MIRFLKIDPIDSIGFRRAEKRFCSKPLCVGYKMKDAPLRRI
jgi:hypothetical protein